MNGRTARRLVAAVALSALAAVFAATANARIPEGSGPTSATVATEQQTQETSGTFFYDPEIYAAMTYARVAQEQQATESGPLDPAILSVILAHARISPLAAKAIQTGVVEQRVARVRFERTAPLPHGIQVGLP